MIPYTIVLRLQKIFLQIYSSSTTLELFGVKTISYERYGTYVYFDKKSDIYIQWLQSYKRLKNEEQSKKLESALQALFMVMLILATWGPWYDVNTWYGECTATCGGGTKLQHRKCYAPGGQEELPKRECGYDPYHNVGDMTLIEQRVPCNTQPCRKITPLVIDLLVK